MNKEDQTQDPGVSGTSLKRELLINSLLEVEANIIYDLVYRDQFGELVASLRDFPRFDDLSDEALIHRAVERCGENDGDTLC